MLHSFDDRKIISPQRFNIKFPSFMKKCVQIFHSVKKKLYSIPVASQNTLENKKTEKMMRNDKKVLWQDCGDLLSLPSKESDIRKCRNCCAKVCACDISQELINTYHDARLLTEKAKKLREDENSCKLQVTGNKMNFFNQDPKICKTIVMESRNNQAEIRELMDMWQEANEKLADRKKAIYSIVENIEQTNKCVHEVSNLLADWFPNGRIEKLRNEQRASEKENQAKMQIMEDRQRNFAKEEVEKMLRKREIRREDEKLREEKRKKQRQRNTLAIQNVTEHLQQYIDKRKALSNQ